MDSTPAPILVPTIIDTPSMKLRDFAGTAVRSRLVRAGEKVELSDIIFNEMVTPSFPVLC